MNLLPSTQPLRPGCTDGLVTTLTEDGPEAIACTCPVCRGRAHFSARTDVRAGFTAAMTAANDDEEIF